MYNVYKCVWDNGTSDLRSYCVCQIACETKLTATEMNYPVYMARMVDDRLSNYKRTTISPRQSWIPRGDQIDASDGSEDAMENGRGP